MSTDAGVFVLKKAGELVAMKAASFATEDDFQELLATFPQLLAGDQMDAEQPRRFMLIAREAGIAGEEGGRDRWSLDHLFLDQDGVPTLVEVKRGTDTRLRREVVGQVLDYAANAVRYWPAESLRARFEARHEAGSGNPNAALTSLIGPGADVDAFWETVRANLHAGKVRLLFVADVIPPELRCVVEFLNRQMQPAEVLAIELRQYQGEGLRTLVPIVIGQTQDAVQRRKGRSAYDSKLWTEDAFLEDIYQEAPAALDKVRTILDWMKQRADRIDYNDNPTYPAVGPIFVRDGCELSPFRVWSGAQLAVQFQYLIGKPVFDDLGRRQELLGRLNAIPGVALPPDAITKRKTIDLSRLSDGGVRLLLEVMDWFVEELRAERPPVSQTDRSPATLALARP